MMSEGVLSRAELWREWGRPAVERAVREGRLTPLRHGWYALPNAPAEVQRAIRLGGRLDCVSAAEWYGLWVPSGLGLHIRSRRATPSGSGVTVHRERSWSFTSAVAPMTDALRQVLRRHDAELGLIVLESALNRGLIGWAEAEYMTRQAPERKAAVLAHLSDRSESGTETRVRLFFQMNGVRVRPQVSIPGVGRVDLVVGDRLVIECDSVSFHTGVQNYARDRGRDLALGLAGYKIVRLTYHQVFDDWAATSQRLLRMIRVDRRRDRRIA
ncbi:endonuclease domain-containing protein [Propionibacteriaceae bacterium Y1685]